MSDKREFKQNILYNKSIKQLFLSQYQSSTQATYERIFIRSVEIEQQKNMDLFDFDKNLIEYFLFGLHPKTQQSSNTNGRIVSAYIYWAIANKLRKNNYNPLADVDGKWFDRMSDDEAQFITKDDFNMIINECVNAQDALIFQLLWEGVQGNGNSELRNLTKKDINFDTNTLTLTDDDGRKRFLVVSDQAMHFIRKALSEKQYIKKNGDFSLLSDNITHETELITNEYVFRNSKTRTSSLNTPVDKHTIMRRISTIRDYFAKTGFPIPNLNTKNIDSSP